MYGSLSTTIYDSRFDIFKFFMYLWKTCICVHSFRILYLIIYGVSGWKWVWTIFARDLPTTAAICSMSASFSLLILLNAFIRAAAEVSPIPFIESNSLTVCDLLRRSHDGLYRTDALRHAVPGSL